MKFLTLALLTAVLALAGCTEEPETDDHHDDAPMHTLTVSDAPTTATTGEAFSFNVSVAGDVGTTDHVGAHFWNMTVTDPGAQFSAAHGCAHDAGALPGTFTVTCTISEAGEHTIYGHLRVVDHHAETFNFWSAPFMVTVSDAMN